MRKIAELTGDEFFDVIYALSPVLPMIVDMEVVQAQLFQNYNDNISKARSIIAANKALLEKGGNESKKAEYEKKIKEATKTIYEESSGIFARDMTKIVPLLASKENRGCVFETLAIIECLPIEQIKQYSAPKLIAKIREVIKDADFKSFFSYAEQSE